MLFLFKHSAMYRILVLFLFLTALGFSNAASQDGAPFSYTEDEQALFFEALENYRAFNYEAAVELLSDLEDMPEAMLYKGNSLFALSRYSEASDVFRLVRSLPFSDLSQEATYGLAIVHLAQRNYGRGLTLLAELSQTFDPALSERSERMMESWIGFLSYKQRMAALEDSESQALQRELIRTGIRIHDYEQGRQLINRAQRLRLGRDFVDEMRELHSAIDEERSEAEEVEEQEKSLITYSVPEEFSYRIGVVLPQQQRDDDGFEVSRALYYGLVLAVEEHNQNPENTNIELVLLDLNNEESDSINVNSEPQQADLPRRIEDLIENSRPDILFGPLFSEDARILADVAHSFEIPVLAPLANTEDLTINNSWFFHANPTFSERGKRMAEIAVHYLGHRKISIMVDNTTVGVEEARAFRRRAIELGAEIPYYISEDFQARRFDLSVFSRYFTSNPSLLNMEDDELEIFVNSWVESDALYMPVAGSSAPTIIDLMMTQLLALRSNVQVLGSQEFGQTSINRQAARRFNIVYSEVFYRDNESEQVKNFRDDYRTAYGREPDLFSYIGYDNGAFMANVLTLAGNPEQTQKAMQHEPFQGISQRFNFTDGQINTAILPIHFSDDRFRILELPDEPVFDIIAANEAVEEVQRRLEHMLETYEKEDILELYEQYKNDGLRLSNEFEELFELFKLFNDNEVRAFFTTPDYEDS